MSSASPIPASTDSVSNPERVRIVYFDGVCGFCNHTVNFLLQRDRRCQLMFAPLQGTTAAERLPGELTATLDTLVMQIDDRTYVRSAAVVRMLWTLGGIWAVCGTLLWLIPLPLRNLGYRMVARIRYRLFGKHEACRLPTPMERARFLP
ncbi:MAG: DUF393 domain-containing protein [Planctomycetaceae bacterium]|nr:DUF393 domain-containing protein [Planctomycetaceae bacterium]